MRRQAVFVSQITAAFQLRWERMHIIKLHTLLFALIMGLMLSSPVLSVQFVEDFEYETPGSNSFTNGVFQHNILPPPGGPPGSEWWVIDDGFVNPTPISGNALALAPAIDEIIFDLGLGEYVDYAAVDSVDWGGGTTFEVTGTLDTYTAEILWNGGIWESADTSGANVGEITMIRLMSYEGLFDNLTINVVPEPSTLLLLGLGGLALLRKRRTQISGLNFLRKI